jgi:hypothetical protein
VRWLLDDCENLAITGFDQRRHLLEVRLPLLIGEESRRVRFKAGEVGHRQLQHEGVERTGDIRENACPFVTRVVGAIILPFAGMTISATAVADSPRLAGGHELRLSRCRDDSCVSFRITLTLPSLSK